MRLLITGASGLLGINLAMEAMREEEMTVQALQDRFPEPEDGSGRAVHGSTYKVQGAI